MCPEMPASDLGAEDSTGSPRGSWTPGRWVGIPWALSLRSQGAVQTGTWVMVSLLQGWPGAAGAHPGHLLSGPDGPEEDGEMTLRWPERGLARHSHGRQGQAGGGLQACGPGVPLVGWGQQAAGGCAGHGHRLSFGREEQCCSCARCEGQSWLLEETKTWEVEKRGIFQSRQGQRDCVDCRERLEKERRKTLALQEEKLELQKVSALLAFQWGQDPTGGTLGRSTSHPLSEAKPLIQARTCPMENVRCCPNS